MQWVLLAELLIKFFGPLVMKWLEGLLNKSAAMMEMSASYYSAEQGVHELFEVAKRETWWWQFGRRRALKVYQRIAVNRAGEFWDAMRADGVEPEMTRAEAAEISRELAA